MDPFRPAPQFDGTGFQRWKVLMQAHLQATGLRVCLVGGSNWVGNGSDLLRPAFGYNERWVGFISIENMPLRCGSIWSLQISEPFRLTSTR